MSDTDYQDVATRNGLEILDWFREVTAEIDETPGRLRVLATRRRDLARQLIQVYGLEEAQRLAGVSELTLASLAAEYRPQGAP